MQNAAPLKNRCQSSPIIRIIFSAMVAVVFAAFFVFGPLQTLSLPNAADGVFLVISCLAILLLSCLFLNFNVKISSDITYIALLAIIAAALALRLYLFDHQSRDYEVFLSQWLSQMRSLNGVEPITIPIGDYNMPYLYFLFLVSRLPLYDLYLIKLLSVIFDFVLALGAVKLVSLFIKGDGAVIAAFTASLFVPTLFLNSAYWGQCDGIYAALCVWALYLALSRRPIWSVSLFALAFSFKMQSIFILPIIIFLVLKHKISLKHLTAFPIAFFATLLPAILCGRSFYNTLSIYVDQTSSYPSLTLTCPSLWALFSQSDYGFEVFGTAALFLAGGVIVAFGVYVYLNRDKLTDKLLFDCAFIFTLLLPFLLPRMHERYFYLAEALSVIYVLLHKDRIYVAPVIILTGFCVYSAYLFSNLFIKLELLSIINAAVIIYVIKKFTADLSAESHRPALEENDKKECF